MRNHACSYIEQQLVCGIFLTYGLLEARFMVKQYIIDYASMQQSLDDSVSWLKSCVHNGRMNLVAFYLPSAVKGENLSDNSLCIYTLYIFLCIRQNLSEIPADHNKATTL